MLEFSSPEIIALAYQQAKATVADSRQKLGWKIGFVDTLQRFLVAVLAADHAGLGLEVSGDFKKLITNKIGTPSLGDWGLAGAQLAREIVSDGNGTVHKIAALLAAGDGSKKCNALYQLVTGLIIPGGWLLIGLTCHPHWH